VSSPLPAFGRAKPCISYPRYIAGEWNAPPEDCGGIPGFYEFLDAIAGPDHQDPRHDESFALGQNVEDSSRTGGGYGSLDVGDQALMRELSTGTKCAGSALQCMKEARSQAVNGSDSMCAHF
jgi:hypothetical protein